MAVTCVDAERSTPSTLLVYRDGTGTFHLARPDSPMTLCGFDVEWMILFKPPYPQTRPCGLCRVAWDREHRVRPAPYLPFRELGSPRNG